MDKTGRWGVELLLEEGGRLYREGRYAEALRAWEKAVEGARELGDLGLEMKAVSWEANALSMLGDRAAALSRCTWILGISTDPSRRVEVEKTGVTWQIADAHRAWVVCARFLDKVPVEQLFGVLDAGEAYVRAIGHPGWRSGLLWERASVLRSLGRLGEAIGAAEEGLSLMLRDGSGPGVTLATHRWYLGDLLREAERHEEARGHYQAVLDDPVSSPYGRMTSAHGLAHCALAGGDAAKARALAEQAVLLAESMGDDNLGGALDVLISACRYAGDLPAARSAAERMLAGARRIGSSNRLYYALRSVIDVALDEQDTARAVALLDEAVPHAEAMDRSRGRTIYRDDLRARRDRLAELPPR